MDKKADVGLGTLIVIILIIIVLGWLINEGWKECRADSDCRDNQYCGADFSCHDFKVITKEVVKASPADYTGVAWIIGLCLIAAAVIFRWENIIGTFRKKENKGRAEEQKKSEHKKGRREEYIDLSKRYHAEGNIDGIDEADLERE
jgi:hypothetical protein